jgi:homocysteine S-methyltransferase
MDDFVTASIGPLAPLAPLDVEVDTNDELKGAHSEIARLPSDAIPPADAIGINCTSPAHLPALVRDMTAALDLTGHSADKRPALVLYPDGGAVYDTTTKTWTNRTSGAQDWATDVAAIASEAAGARTSRGNGEAYAWAGVIVGGCCKAGFEEIRLLKQELDRVV